MAEIKPDMPVAPKAQSLRWLGSQAALFAGFGALLILMAIICIDSLHTLGAFETDNAQIRQDFLYRERTLEQVRASLYETGNIMRDYILIESDPHAQEMLRNELQSIESESTAALSVCIQSLPAGKKEPFQHLSMELEHYWSTIGPISGLGAKEKKKPGNSVLRSDVLSQHAGTLAIAKELSAVNDDELKESEQRISEVFGEFRRRLLMVAAMAFGFGLILAGTTIIYAGRLEKRVEEKYEESLQAQRELKELSMRLVEAEERNDARFPGNYMTRLVNP